MTNKLSYMHKVHRKSSFSRLLLIFYFISCEVDRHTQPSSIHLNSQPYHHSDTRWFRLILYDLYFSKIHWPLRDLTETGNRAWKVSSNQGIKRLVTKKDLGPFKIDRAVVDSNRSVNLPFDIRKILCTYPRKRKDIRDLKMFQMGDLSSFLAGGLTCIRRGDLFVSWSGCREDQTP